MRARGGELSLTSVDSRSLRDRSCLGRRRRALMNQLLTCKMISAIERARETIVLYLAHLKSCPHAELIFHFFSGIRRVKMLIKPLSQYSCCILGQVSPSFPCRTARVSMKCGVCRIVSRLLRASHDAIVS